MLAATDGITPELALDGGTVASVSAPSGEVVHADGRILVSGLIPGTDALVEVETADGARVGLLVLERGDGPAPALDRRRGAGVRGRRPRRRPVLLRPVWDIALDGLPAEPLRAHGLRLLLPLPAGAPVHLPAEAADAAGTAAVHRAEWVTTRPWAVRTD